MNVFAGIYHLALRTPSSLTISKTRNDPTSGEEKPFFQTDLCNVNLFIKVKKFFAPRNWTTDPTHGHYRVRYQFLYTFTGKNKTSERGKFTFYVD